MNQLLFKFQESHQLRVIEKDGEPWFVAADVCAVLELGNITKALLRLDDDEATLISIQGRTPTGGEIEQQVNAINESGLYSLILGSRKPEAKPFKKWVTSEVLPSIRKTGVYADLNNNLTALNKEDIFHNLMTLAADVRKQLPADYVVNDYGVLLNKGTGNQKYFQAMNSKGLPGVSVSNNEIMFDWVGTQNYDDDIVDGFLSSLREKCKELKSCGRRAPFSSGNTFEVIKGFKTNDDAQRFANEILKMAAQLNG